MCLCQTPQHFICKSIMTHFTKNGILTPVQHGFRTFMRKSITIDHQSPGSKLWGGNSDFSKAFDVVPHQRLLHKLDHYGIRGSTLLWIKKILTTRLQKVVVDGSFSNTAHVVSHYLVCHRVQYLVRSYFYATIILGLIWCSTLSWRLPLFPAH